MIDFPGTQQVVKVRRTRTTKTPTGAKKTVEVVYLISSASMIDAQPATIAGWIQGRWNIENHLHWVRDTCRESPSQTKYYLSTSRDSHDVTVAIMDISPDLIAAVAATVAAVLAGISLWLSGSRDERRWRRDALLDTVVQFLDASFAAPGGLSLEKLRAGDYTTEDRQRHETAHQEMLQALTRLRVLASSEIVKSAEIVHRCDNARRMMLATGVVDDADWARAGTERNAARLELLTQARKTMKLGPATDVNGELMRITYSPVQGPATPGTSDPPPPSPLRSHYDGLPGSG